VEKRGQVHSHRWITPPRWLIRHRRISMPGMRMRDFRDMPDTLTIIRDVVHITDDIVARSDEMTKKEIIQEVMRIASTGHPALTYQIARRRRGQRHGRQQG